MPLEAPVTIAVLPFRAAIGAAYADVPTVASMRSLKSPPWRPCASPTR